MSPYDFSTVIDRTGTGSRKWDIMKQLVPDLPSGICPFSVADLDIPHPPEIIQGLIDHLASGAILGYTTPTAQYRRVVADWMERRHGWQVDPEWIRDSPGIVTAFFAAVAAFTEPGDGVIIQTPAYYPFFMAIDRQDRTLAANPLILSDGAYVIDYDGLERLAKDPKNKILLFCSPHNPTGRVWKREELAEVARICRENDVVLLSDEIHFDLVMPGHEHTVMAKLDDLPEHVIVCTAPSKSFNLAGMHTSNIIIPNPETRERWTTQMMSTGFFSLTTLGYKACELAYTRGEAWLDGLVALVAHNHEVLKAYMAEHLPEVHVFDLEGTYLQWMDFRAFGLPADELERIMTTEAFCFFDEGYIFGADEGSGFERMNIACPTDAMVAALERVTTALRTYTTK